MAGLATHLHYHEPSNYALVSFLQCGLFHELCQPEKNGKPAAPFKLNDWLAKWHFFKAFWKNHTFQTLRENDSLAYDFM